MPVEIFTTCAIDHFTWLDHYPAATTELNGVVVHRFPVSPARDSEHYYDIHHGINRGDAHLGYLEHLEWMSNSVWSDELEDALIQETPRLHCRVALPYLFGTTFWAVAENPEKTALIPCLHNENHAKVPAIKAMLEQSAGCLANSPAEEALIRRIAPKARTTLGSMGFDPPALPPDPAKFCADRGISPGYLLYAGRREESKGVPLLFDYYARYIEDNPDAPPLAMMGSGTLPAPPQIAKRIIELGFVPNEDKLAAVAAASVFVHPSTNESFGAVVAEAMLQRVPVLVTAHSPVLVDHCRDSGGGLWFASYPEFAESLDLLLGDDELRAKMGDGGFRYITGNHSWSHLRDRYLSALDIWIP